MSVQALTWSFNLRLDDMAAKSALHALADHADDTGHCWPSIKRIALFMGCSENTARRAVRRLVELGLIVCDTTKGGAGITNRFALMFNWKPSHVGTPPDLNPSNGDENPPILNQNPPNVTENPPTLGPEPPRTIKNRQGTPNGESRVRLPADWRPSPVSRDHAASKGLDPDAVLDGEFGDYFTGGRGRNEKRTLGEGRGSWDSRFRIWCDREASFKSRGAGIRSPGSGGESGAFARAGARLGRS